MVSLLAAADIITRVITDFAELNGTEKQLIPRRSVSFAYFAGEHWGYLGSLRFLHEIQRKGASVQGMSTDFLELPPSFWNIIEVESIALKTDTHNDTFYIHHSKKFDVDSDLYKQMKNLETHSIFKIASENNPGLPPSSLMALGIQAK